MSFVIPAWQKVYRAQLTMLSYPYTTKDGTKLYLAKLGKGLVKDYKGNRN